MKNKIINKPMLSKYRCGCGRPCYCFRRTKLLCFDCLKKEELKDEVV